MSEEIQRILGDLMARVSALEKGQERNWAWITKGILGVIGVLSGIVYAYLSSLGII